MGIRTPESANSAESHVIGELQNDTHGKVSRVLGNAFGFSAEAVGYTGGAIIRGTGRFARGAIRGTLGM